MWVDLVHWYFAFSICPAVGLWRFLWLQKQQWKGTATAFGLPDHFVEVVEERPQRASLMSLVLLSCHLVRQRIFREDRRALLTRWWIALCGKPVSLLALVVRMPSLVNLVSSMRASWA